MVRYDGIATDQRGKGEEYMIVLWVILALLALLFLLPYGVDVGYREEKFFLKVKAGPLRIPLIPAREKTPEEKAARERKKQEKAAKKEEKRAGNAEKEGGEAPKEEKTARCKSLFSKAGAADYLELAGAALRAVKRIFRSFRTDYLYLRCTVSTPDPCDTALLYGRLCALVEILLDEKQGLLRVKKKDVYIDTDYLRGSIWAEGEIVISAALWRLVGAALILGVEFLRWRGALKKKDAGTERTDDHGRE